MKIFNWVHRRFSLKDGFGRNVKKDEFISKDADSKALLENVALVDFVDGWEAGLLTIGTLGFDQLQHFIEQEECQFSDQNGEESETDDDEYLQNYEYCEINSKIAVQEGGVELNPLILVKKDDLIAPKANLIVNVNGNPLPATKENIIDFDMNDKDLGDGRKKKKKRERITLADLFSAESNENTEQNQGNGDLGLSENSAKYKNSPPSKHGLSFAKKLIPRVGDDLRPTHKLHQLMTRMLKRRIHPEVEGKYQKSRQSKATMFGLLSDKHALNDSVSLLNSN